MLLQLLKNKILMKRLGIVAIILGSIIVLCLIGTWIGLSAWGCLLLTFLAIIGILGFKIWKMHAAHKQEAMANNISAELNVDLTSLKDKLFSAINKLKNSELGLSHRSNQAIYTLPWYLLIGGNGAGKTSLLRHSGLKFPLTMNGDINKTGQGGTENCDWWLSEDAVVLDTAGRYLTDEDSKSEWLGLLQLLKQNRRQLPANGVILALSLSDILKQDAIKADILRERIDELNQQLGYILPINIVLTKCDELEGFAEFFAGLSQAEQQQVWGIDLRGLANNENIVHAIHKKFEALYQRLTAIGLQRLDFDMAMNKKIEAFKFIQVFQKALSQAEDFLTLLISKNPYQSQFNVRGVYFTKSGYFISSLFKTVIFAEKDSAIMNKKTKFFSLSSKVGLLSGAGLLLLISLIFFGVAYSFNHTLLNSSVVKVQHLRAVMNDPDSDAYDLLSAQFAVYDQFETLYDHKDRIPFHLRFGLFAGNKQEAALQQILAASLQRNLVPQVAALYQAQLTKNAAAWTKLNAAQQKAFYFSYYQTLKDYLMLAVYDPEVSDQDADSIAQNWQTALTTQKNSENSFLNVEKLKDLVNFYLNDPYSGFTPDSLQTEWMPDKTIVANARTQLQRPVDIQLLYTKLVASLRDKLPPVSANKLLSGSAADFFVNRYAIPGMYTKAGWNSKVSDAIQTIAIQASSGDWTLNQPIELNTDISLKPVVNLGVENSDVAHQLEASLLQYYFNEYLSAWEHWLLNVRVRNFSSINDASDALNTLSKSHGPMVKLLQIVNDNLNIHDAGDHLDLFNDTTGAGQIYAAFSNEKDFINPTLVLDQSKSLQAYLKSINAIRTDLRTIESSPNEQQAAQQFTSSILNASGSSTNLYQASAEIDQLLEADTNPKTEQAMESLLDAPLRGVWSTLLTIAAGNIQSQWQNNVIPAYQSEIAGKFPFDPNGDDISMDMVKSFFAPQTGTYWTFVNQQLVPYVKQSGAHWTLNTWLGIGMNLSPAFMNNLQQAQDITATLFSNGVDTPQFFYSFFPITQGNISMMGILVDGSQRYDYENGPQEWHYFKWNINQKPQSTNLIIIKDDGESQAQLQTAGVWSLFKLLSRATSITRNDTDYFVQWNLTATDGSVLAAKVRFKIDGTGDAINGFVKQPFAPPQKIMSN